EAAAAAHPHRRRGRRGPGDHRRVRQSSAGQVRGRASLIVRNVDEITDTDADIKTPNWRSKRIVLAREKAGFSVHETTLYAGTVNDFWYANHIEAVFVVEGEGEITNKETGETF